MLNDFETGEVITAIDLGESMYWENGTQLTEQKELLGRIRYRTIGPDGPGEWKDAPPPPSRSAGN